MKKTLFLTAIIYCFSLTAFGQQDKRAASAGMHDAKQLINNWPGEAKKAAMAMINKYGNPTEHTENMLIWRNNGPWKKTVVYKEEVDHRFPMPHKDVLEQFVDMKIPADKFSALAEYDGSVIAERTKGVISARCDKEEMNMLALNLANDIIEGKKSVEDARKFFTETAMAFMKGEKPEYTQKLMFSPNKNSGDPDKPSMSDAQIKEGMEMMKKKESMKQ